MTKNNTSCPCGTGKNYENCCGPFIEGKEKPQTPEALMRSRYTAYTQANIDYIVKTMRGAAMQDFSVQEAEAWAKRVKWRGLEVISSNTIPLKGMGHVEFKAMFEDNNQVQTMYELSMFQFDSGQWFYIGNEKHVIR